MQLDASQSRVASIGPSERQIVIAGPGSGKTQTVAALAARLVAEHDVYPEEILVISFSRAAVAAVRDRTTHVADDGYGVQVSTFDSLASQVLRESRNRPLDFKGYEANIRLATAELKANGWETLDTFRHLIIDEVQDVVGVRAEFALALLGELPKRVGFTLLGDPMQALYDFQISPRNPLTVDEFLRSVYDRHAPLHQTLEGEYRARSKDGRRASRLRDELMGSPDSARLIALRRLVSELAPMGSLDSDAIADIAAWRGTTALLCDTNARAALVFDRFMSHGVQIDLAAGLQNAGVSAWVADLSSSVSGTRVSRSTFLQLTEGKIPDPAGTWLQLVHISNSGRELDLRALSSALARRVPQELQRTSESPIVASTVHRAKGLEFDNVVLVDVDRWGGVDADEPSLIHQLFVALSRARRQLTTASGVDTRRWFRQKQWPHLWVKGARGGVTGAILEPWLVPALQVPLPHDLRGRNVTWGAAEERQDPDGRRFPVWVATVGDQAIANTGSDFGFAMARASFSGALPSLEGGWVEGLETCLEAAPAGQNMWMGARVAGPVTVNWR